MKKYIVLVAVSVLTLLSAIGCEVAEVAYRDISFTVAPTQTYNLNVTMQPEDVIEGYFSVKGGNNDMHFYLEDSIGNKLLNIYRVQGRYDFSYEATLDGFHTLFFDNSFSMINSKLVSVHFRIR